MDEVERSSRVKLLIALEIGRIVGQLRERMDFLLTIWSRHRAREPFLETLFSRWRTVGLADLALLEPSSLAALEAFHAEVDDLRLFLTWTEDMPVTLRDTLEARLVTLELYGDRALEALGVEPPAPPVDELPLDVPGEA